MSIRLMALCAAALAFTATPALADPPPWAPAHGKRAKQDKGHKAHKGNYGYDQESRVYDQNGRYYEPRRLSNNDSIWRGNDGNYHCRRSNGTTGLIIGGAVGALLGRELDGGRRRTVGTVIGAAGGALLGREVARGSLRCR